MSQADEIFGYATFHADLPDDQVEIAGDIVKPGGAAITELLRAAIEKRGLLPSAVSPRSFYGWTFDVSIDGVVIGCMIQFPDPWLLITDVRGRFYHRLLRRQPDAKHRAVLSVLKE